MSSSLLQQCLVSAQICILDLGGVVEEQEFGVEGRVGCASYRAPEISLGEQYWANIRRGDL